ncbi:hypothetical protein PtA15_14A185 [Puccinia triticina]|uniref:Uncharacterized protein n=1 Tax=Puccinia triticina TaxID=208348 RepID=A0ABY7D3Z3_9BASI|nr:uncharacterized protein PtA15_14A185 [Puccinia triticina]WAQ91303.1 hypothetical protein PtA15_14A185 [Puccinia triticina]
MALTALACPNAAAIRMIAGDPSLSLELSSIQCLGCPCLPNTPPQPSPPTSTAASLHPAPPQPTPAQTLLTRPKRPQLRLQVSELKLVEQLHSSFPSSLLTPTKGTTKPKKDKGLAQEITAIDRAFGSEDEEAWELRAPSGP